MNMPFFNESFFMGADGVELGPRWWDTGTTIVREVVFSGKFNSIFSMLFAIGFTIQLERLEQRQPTGARDRRNLLRRVSRGDHDLLCVADRSRRPSSDLARAHGAGDARGAHAAHELPVADADRDVAVLTYGRAAVA